MNYVLCFLCPLLFALPTFADDKTPAPPTGPHLTIPAEVTPTGQYARFVPDTDCVGVMYVGLDGIDSVPADLLKDGRTFLLDTRGLAVGRYRFSAIGAEKDGVQLRTDFAVVVGTPPPGPGPTPPGPTPPNDLTAKLQAAYDADKDADRAASLSYLQGVFIILAAKATSHSEWKTNADAMTYEKAVAESAQGGLLPITDPKAQVASLRKAIGDALLALLGDATKAADLNAIAAGFSKVAQALQGVH